MSGVLFERKKIPSIVEFVSLFGTRRIAIVELSKRLLNS